MLQLLRTLALLALPYLIRLFVRRVRRGKIIDIGTVKITKDWESNTFKSMVRINGREIEGMFDTGASMTTIGTEDAQKAGIDVTSLYFDTDVDTATGVKYHAIAEISLDTFQIGPITIKNLGVGVNRYIRRKCLVGMNFFESLDSFEIEGNVLTLRMGQDAKTFDSSIDEPSPDKGASTTVRRILAKCPYCPASMRLPAGKEGNVKCHSCKMLFFADTNTIENGKAQCRPVQ